MPVEVVHGNSIIPIAQIVFWVGCLFLPPHAADCQQNRCQKKRQKVGYFLSRRTHQYWRFGLKLLKERAGDLHSYSSPSVRSSSRLMETTQLHQDLAQEDEALGLAGYVVFTFFLTWVRKPSDVAAWLMKKLWCCNGWHFNTYPGTDRPTWTEDSP